MIWSKKRFQHSVELFPSVFKEVAPFLLPLSFALWGLEYYVAWLNKSRFEDPYNSSMIAMVAVGLLGVVLQSLIGVFWTLAVSGSTRRHSLNGHGTKAFPFAIQHFHQALIEYVRSLLSTGLYTLFLILPGILRWVQLSFTVLVSAFDPAYDLGQKDALRESRRLVKGALFPLFGLMFIQAVTPLALEEIAKSASISLAMAIILYTVSWVINLYLSIYFILTFFARTSFKAEDP